MDILVTIIISSIVSFAVTIVAFNYVGIVYMQRQEDSWNKILDEILEIVNLKTIEK